MLHLKTGTHIQTSDFDLFVSDVAMSLWNRITASPKFQGLQPKDYPEVYEALLKALKPYQESSSRPKE